MAASSVTSRGLDNRETLISDESYSSGISWAAVIAGAFVAASLWLILLSLGTGLGVSSVSPWSNLSASASTIGKAAILWLIITEIIASSMGGYLAGRLRTKWATIHTDEVYFRDTAHGFLVWAVGLVITASFLASAATSMVGSAGTLRSPSLSASAVADPNEYFIDKLFRPDHPGFKRHRFSSARRGDTHFRPCAWARKSRGCRSNLSGRSDSWKEWPQPYGRRGARGDCI